MNKTTIWEILNTTYSHNPSLSLSVSNKTKEITIGGYGSPDPVIGNLEELYKKNKSKADKTAKELIEIAERFVEEENKRFQKLIKKRKEGKKDEKKEND